MIEMTPANTYASVFLVVLGLGVGIHKYLIYPAFLSPLSKIPTAHPFSAFTSLWMLWIRYQDREVGTVHAAHKRYGPVVRLGPNEVSINLVEGGTRIVYGGGFEKPQYYSIFSNYGLSNTFSSLHSEVHAVHRRRVSKVYSKSWLQSSPHVNFVSSALLHDRLLPLLAECANNDTPVEVLELMYAYGSDFFSGIFFGLSCGTNFIQDEAERKRWLSTYLEAYPPKYLFWALELPNFTAWLAKIGINMVPKWREAAKCELEKWCLKLCDAAEETLIAMANGKGITSGNLPAEYQQLRIATAKEMEQTDSPSLATLHPPQRLEIASELLDHLVASRDTLGIALTYVLLELSRHPDIQRRLQQELHTLSTPINFPSVNQMPLNNKELSALPFLRAVITESLRLRPSVPLPHPRLTPLSTSTTLGDFTGIPPNVRVIAFSWCLHRNPDAFPDPERWDPERWMNDEEVTDKMGGESLKRKWFWAFGSGPRKCLASNVSELVFQHLIAAVYTNFTTRVVNDKGFSVDRQFVAGIPDDKLILKFELLRH